MLRAAHQLLDGDPKILEDPVAIHLLSDSSLDAIRTADPLQEPVVRLARSATVLCGRFIEDQLMSAIERGVRQYVLLGAGFDTFAYRQPAGHPIFVSSRLTIQRRSSASRNGSPPQA